jgi:hypothetical protein
MRSFKEIYEKREQALYRCRYPGCKHYGNIASKSVGGVVCKAHATSI